MDVLIRQAKPLDALPIAKIGLCYYLSNYRETLLTLTPKIAAGECLVAETGSYVVGYLLAVPMRSWEVPPVSVEYIPVSDANCLYLNTLCVMERFRGNGFGRQLLERALHGRYDILSLVALNNSEHFWRRYGFEPLRQLNYFNQPGLHMERKRQ